MKILIIANLFGIFLLCFLAVKLLKYFSSKMLKRLTIIYSLVLIFSVLLYGIIPEKNIANMTYLNDKKEIDHIEGINKMLKLAKEKKLNASNKINLIEEKKFAVKNKFSIYVEEKCYFEIPMIVEKVDSTDNTVKVSLYASNAMLFNSINITKYILKPQLYLENNTIVIKNNPKLNSKFKSFDVTLFTNSILNIPFINFKTYTGLLNKSIYNQEITEHVTGFDTLVYIKTPKDIEIQEGTSFYDIALID